MSDVRQDAALIDLHLPLHAKKLEQHLHTSLRRKHLRDKRSDSAKWPLQNLHLAANLDLRANLNGLRINHHLAQSLNYILPDNGCNTSKLDDVGNAMAGP